MSELKQFSRNTLFLTMSYALRFGAGVLLTVLVGNMASDSDFGRFTLALTVSTFFGVAADFGLPALTVRDVARDHDVAHRYYHNILGLKVVFSILGFFAVVAFANLLNYPAETRRVLYPIAAFTFIASLGNYHFFLFRGLERMHFETAGAMIHNVSLIVCVSVGLLLPFSGNYVPISHVTGGYLAAGVLSTSVIIIVLGRRVASETGGIGFSLDLHYWGSLLKQASFFALYGFLGLIYMQIDTVMLSKLRIDPEAEIALYQAPVKLLTAAAMTVAVVINVFTPMLSRRYHQGPLEDFKALVHTLNRIGITILAPIIVFSFAFSREIMSFLFPSTYAASAPILMILSVGFLIWDGPPYGVVFVSMGKQKINFYVSAVCAVANIVLNLIFIPRYGPIAAAATTLATYVLMKALYLYFCKTRLGSVFINSRYFTALALCSVLATALKLIGLHVIVSGVIFCAVYAAGSYLFILTPAEKDLCRRLLRTVNRSEAAA